MQSARRNNVMAGLFLVASLLLAVGISFWLNGGGTSFGAEARYGVLFDLDESVAGLEPGSPVLVGGKAVGAVVAVELRTEPAPDAGGRPGPAEAADGPDDAAGGRVAVGMRVTMELPAGLTLYDNARVYAEQPIFGTLARLNISDVGGPRPGGPAAVLAEGGELRASAAPGLLGAFGLGPEEAERLKAVLLRLDSISESADSLIARADRLAGDLLPEDRPSAALNIYDTTAEIAAFSRELNATYAARLDRITANAEAASSMFPSIAEDVRLAIADARRAVAEAEALAGDARSVVADNRPRIDSAADDLASVMAWADRQAVESLEPLLADARDAAANLDGLTGDAHALLLTEEPQIVRTLANLRLVSDQALLLFEEVRAAPWRLLNRPSRKELEQEILYGATRAYARAVSDIRSSSERLDAALRGAGEAGPVTREELEALRETLNEAFDRLPEAEQRLFDLLSRETAQRAGG